MSAVNQLRNIALIVAGGRGRRMKRDKQFIKLNGKPMLEWTIAAFQKNRLIDGIILVLSRKNLARARRLKYSKLLKAVAGGAERQDSVRNGLAALPASAEIVLVHDGARPAVSQGEISRSIAAARRYGAAVVAVPVKDTIKRAPRPSSTALKTVDRKDLWAAQTPQAFDAAGLRGVYRKISGAFTDDASLFEKAGLPVKIVRGSYENIKVTVPEDVWIMEAILGSRR